MSAVTKQVTARAWICPFVILILPLAAGTSRAKQPERELGAVGINLVTLPHRGVFVGGLAPGGPAGRAGLQIGDEILQINARPVDSNNFKNLLEQTDQDGPGARWTIMYVRNGARATVSMTAEARSAVYAAGVSFWGSNGAPGVEFLALDNRTVYFIESEEINGEREHALAFPAEMNNTVCFGFLAITAGRITFKPIASGSSRCEEPVFLRTEIRNIKVSPTITKMGGFLSGVYGQVLIRAAGHGSHYYGFSPVWSNVKNLNAYPSARQEFADWFNLAVTDFSAAEKRFNQITSSLFWLEREETKEGDSAAKGGELFDALQDYQAGLKSLPVQWVPSGPQEELRRKIIQLLPRMNPRPAIPQDALRYEAYAATAYQESTGPQDLTRAAQNLNAALLLAPWWGDAYKNLGLVLEKTGRFDAAAGNLQLYLLATPNAPDAQKVQSQIYSLQYQAQHPPYLGVGLNNLTPDLVKKFALPDATGAYVQRVDAGGPAAQAGIKPGDVIRTFNGLAVSSSPALVQMIQTTRPGTSVTLGIVRDGKPMALPVQIAARP